MISPKWQFKYEIKYGAIILQPVPNALLEMRFSADLNIQGTFKNFFKKFKHSEYIQNLGFLAVMKNSIQYTKVK